MHALEFANSVLFLSTLSLRRATAAFGQVVSPELYFYPRSPYGERPVVDNIIFVPREFLSTLSLRRATRISEDVSYSITYFYPRSPYGERHNRIFHVRSFTRISIHALLTESDSLPSVARNSKAYFYPRSPYGERRLKKDLFGAGKDFYPRSPYGERPLLLMAHPVGRKISIHALLTESDILSYSEVITEIRFLSTLSLRRATTRTQSASLFA